MCKEQMESYSCRLESSDARSVFGRYSPTSKLAETLFAEMTPSLRRITWRRLMLVLFVLPCLIVAGTLSSSNGSPVRLAGSFGTIVRKQKLVNPVVNRAQDLGNRQATRREEEKTRISTIEMKIQNSTRAEQSVDTSKRVDPQPIRWNGCRSRPVFKARQLRCTTL